VRQAWPLAQGPGPGLHSRQPWLAPRRPRRPSGTATGPAAWRQPAGGLRHGHGHGRFLGGGDLGGFFVGHRHECRRAFVLAQFARLDFVAVAVAAVTVAATTAAAAARFVAFAFDLFTRAGARDGFHRVLEHVAVRRRGRQFRFGRRDRNRGGRRVQLFQLGFDRLLALGAFAWLAWRAFRTLATFGARCRDCCFGAFTCFTRSARLAWRTRWTCRLALELACLGGLVDAGLGGLALFAATLGFAVAAFVAALIATIAGAWATGVALARLVRPA
jgi:hypothetical protein